MVVFFALLNCLVLSVLVVAVYLLSGYKSSIFASEKLTPFESGFDPKFSSSYPFSISFFLVCVVFLIFDVELAVLFPYLTTVEYFWQSLGWFFLSVLWFLTLGFIWEWSGSKLEWEV